MFNLENALLKLAETTHKFLICIDMEGKYSYVNEAYKNKFKKDNEAILGKYVLEDIHHEDHALVIDTVNKCCANIGLAHEVIIRKPTTTPGVYTYSRWDFIAIANEAGAPDYMICVGSEITSFINEIEDYLNKLKNVAFDQSHLVRKPLANILGLSKLLSEMSTEELQENKTLLKKVYTEAKKLDRIVKIVVSKTKKEA